MPQLPSDMDSSRWTGSLRYCYNGQIKPRPQCALCGIVIHFGAKELLGRWLRYRRSAGRRDLQRDWYAKLLIQRPTFVMCLLHIADHPINRIQQLLSWNLAPIGIPQAAREMAI